MKLRLGHELIDLAVGQLAFGGERVRTGRAAHAMAGEGDGRARQREHDVGGCGQRRPRSPGDGVAEHADVGDPGRARPFGGGGDALHARQGGHAFLHPAAAGGDE